MLQEALAAAAAHYQHTGEEDVYPPGAHAIGHGGEGPEGDASQMGKRTSDWVQEGEEEQDEAKKARLDGDPGSTCFRIHPPCYHACAMKIPDMQAHHIIRWACHAAASTKLIEQLQNGIGCLPLF